MVEMLDGLPHPLLKYTQIQYAYLMTEQIMQKSGGRKAKVCDAMTWAGPRLMVRTKKLGK